MTISECFGRQYAYAGRQWTPIMLMTISEGCGRQKQLCYGGVRWNSVDFSTYNVVTSAVQLSAIPGSVVHAVNY